MKSLSENLNVFLTLLRMGGDEKKPLPPPYQFSPAIFTNEGIISQNRDFYI